SRAPAPPGTLIVYWWYACRAPAAACGQASVPLNAASRAAALRRRARVKSPSLPSWQRAMVAATVVRLGKTDASVMLSYEQGFLKILLLSAAFSLCMYYFDLYDSSILSNRREVLTRLVQVLGTVSIAVACLYYVYPPLELGRGIFLIGLAMVAVILMLWRRLFLAINNLPQFA